MNNALGVSPSKGKQGTTRGKEKNLLTSMVIEPTTSGLELPLLCRLSYKVAQRKSGSRVVPLFITIHTVCDLLVISLAFTFNSNHSLKFVSSSASKSG